MATKQKLTYNKFLVYFKVNVEVEVDVEANDWEEAVKKAQELTNNANNLVKPVQKNYFNDWEKPVLTGVYRVRA